MNEVTSQYVLVTKIAIALSVGTLRATQDSAYGFQSLSALAEASIRKLADISVTFILKQ